MYLVVYAKVIYERDEAIKISEPLIGGIELDRESAQRQARNCINNAKNSTILTRIQDIGTSIVDCLYEAADYFESLAVDMSDANMTLVRSNKN